MSSHHGHYHGGGSLTSKVLSSHRCHYHGGEKIVRQCCGHEKQEDVLVIYLEYLDKISKVIEISDKKLKEIDHSGVFKSDDEVGAFFKSIVQIQDILNDFKIKRLK